MRRIFAIAVCANLIPLLASAQVIITEVMYDLKEGSDSGHEWIEVYNAGAPSLTLASWKVFENGKYHSIQAVQGTFSPGSFAVIADNAEKFKDDYPEYAGALFDSVFSLNNKGESVAIHDAKGVASDEITYTTALGAKGTGDSLQKIELVAGAALAPGMPTPGEGVPVSGLILAPQSEKAAHKSARAAAAVPVPEIKGAPPQASLQHHHVAAVIQSGGTSISLWLLGVIAISIVGAIGVVYARHLARSEWEIIEET